MESVPPSTGVGGGTSIVRSLPDAIGAFSPPLEHRCGDLVIRAYQPGDGLALQRAMVASYHHLRPWMHWAKAEQSVEESEAICRRFAGRYLLGEDFVPGLWIECIYAAT
jgi:hypothetical protein